MMSWQRGHSQGVRWFNSQNLQAIDLNLFVDNCSMGFCFVDIYLMHEELL